MHKSKRYTGYRSSPFSLQAVCMISYVIVFTDCKVICYYIENDVLVITILLYAPEKFSIQYLKRYLKFSLKTALRINRSG